MRHRWLIIAALLGPTVAHAAPCPSGDTDGDGYPDSVEDRNGDGDCDNDDFDRDGTPDYRDDDDDDDGVPSACERVVDLRDGLDDGMAVNIDSDFDDVDDRTEWDWPSARDGLPLADCTALQDWDEDGIPDVLDEDDDGDGIGTLMEGQSDIDGTPPASGSCDTWGGELCSACPSLGDGLPNYLDLDSDGDGLLDADERSDDDADGIPGFRDCYDCSSFADEPADSDDDGLPDVIETRFKTDVCSVDSDEDGVWDVYEGEREDEFSWSPFDSDKDGIIDALDEDDDDDGKPTRREDPDPDGDGDPVDAADDDADGIPDYLDPVEDDLDRDDDGIPNDVEERLGSDPDNADSDGDGVNDGTEAALTMGGWVAPDWDEDGIADLLDPDDDGDGVLTRAEGSDPDGDLSPRDAWNTDGDELVDYLDVDDDGDGILTIDENPDPNGDGLPDDALDGDRDGTPDYLDAIDDPFDTGDTDEPADPDDDGGCGCSSAGPASAWWLGGLIALLGARRRRGLRSPHVPTHGPLPPRR